MKAIKCKEPSAQGQSTELKYASSQQPENIIKEQSSQSGKTAKQLYQKTSIIPDAL